MADFQHQRRPDAAHPAPVRVLVIDDSAVARAALSRMVEDHPAFVVAAALDGARRAIDWLKNSSADIVLLDIEMPGLDGLTALPELLTASRGARVLIVSSVAADGAAATVQALALGATDTLAKPAVGGLGRLFAAKLTERMLRLGRVESAGPGDITEKKPVLRPLSQSPVACLAIGASTGGIHALAAFFAGLPPTFDAPILITQHLPTAFMPFFADQLATLSGRKTSVGRNGAVLRRGEIIVAPGDAHLSCVQRGNEVRIALVDCETASRCCPSVDPMLGSVAEVFGTRGVGIMLSGMGRDGSEGAAIMTARGANILVQDRQSSAVWGMPGSVVGAGLASLVGSPGQLAAHLAQRGSAK